MLGAWVLSVVANAYLIVPASVLPRIARDFGTEPGDGGLDRGDLRGL